MEGTILDYTLNAPLDISKLLTAVVLWYILWHLVIKRILWKCEVTSFWYALYELGAFGTFGIVVFLSIIAILFIASIQAVIGYGIKMLVALFLFWGIIVTFVVLIIKHIRKKK
jgi:hypothetical protein